MTTHQHASEHDGNDLPIWRRPVALAAATAALIAAFYLLREHWGHMLGLWPYLLLLACPLMHLMHGHGGHAGHGSDPGRAKSERD